MPKGWSSEESRRLMSIVLDVRQPGNPTALDWNKVISVYNAQSTVECDRIQAANHYSNCRYKWLAWREMTQMTGVAFTEDGLPTIEELHTDRMKQFIQKHKAGGSGKYVTKYKLYDLDLWNPIFGGRCATGEKSYSPTLAKSQSKLHTEKRKRTILLSDDNEGSGDSEDPLNIDEVDGGLEKPAESRSPPNTTSSKRQKRSGSSVVKGKKSSEIDKAFEILKIVEMQESHEKKLYQAVKKMEQVKMRGPDFQGKCIYYLMEKKLDKMFLEFETDIEKWAWLKGLDEEAEHAE